MAWEISPFAKSAMTCEMSLITCRGLRAVCKNDSGSLVSLQKEDHPQRPGPRSRDVCHNLAVHLEGEMQAVTSTWPDGALREPLTSMFSRFARNHDDCANRKSPASTATRVPYLLLIVSLPVQQTHPDSRVKVSAHVYAPISLHR